MDWKGNWWVSYCQELAWVGHQVIYTSCILVYPCALLSLYILISPSMLKPVSSICHKASPHTLAVPDSQGMIINLLVTINSISSISYTVSYKLWKPIVSTVITLNYRTCSTRFCMCIGLVNKWTEEQLLRM